MQYLQLFFLMRFCLLWQVHLLHFIHFQYPRGRSGIRGYVSLSCSAYMSDSSPVCICCILVPVFYMFGIPYAAPIAIALVAGLGGMVPAVMGVVLYFSQKCTKEISRLLATEDVENEIEAFKQLSDVIIHNKEMYAAMIIFAITILQLLQFCLSSLMITLSILL